MDIDIAVSDFDIVTALRIGANPGFVRDGSTLAAKV
jgi:hypothetical protein